MCLICSSIDKLTFLEGLRNLREIEESLSAEHYKEVLAKLDEKNEKKNEVEDEYGLTRLYSDYLMFL